MDYVSAQACPTKMVAQQKRKKSSEHLYVPKALAIGRVAIPLAIGSGYCQGRSRPGRADSARADGAEPIGPGPIGPSR